MRAPLPDCRINNALIQFVHSQAVRIRERSLSASLIRPLATLHAALSHAYCLVVGIFVPKNSIVTKFCHLALGGPVIMPHRVV